MRLRHALAGALLLASGLAGAEVTSAGPSWTAPSANSYKIVFASDGTPLLSNTRSYGALSGGAVQVGDAGRIAGPQLDVQVTRKVPWSSVLRISAKVARALPLLSTGMAALDILEEFRFRPNGENGLVWDEGQPQQNIPTTIYVIANVEGSSPEDVCRAYYEYVKAFISPGVGSYSLTSPTRCDIYWANGAPERFGTITKKTEGRLTCPAFTDPLDPEYNIPAGTPVGPDGKCRAGRYGLPVEDPFVESKVGAGTSSQHARSVQAVKEAVEKGHAVPAEAPQVTGPATTPGPAKSVTTTPKPTAENPNPEPVTKTVSTVNNYTYEGDTITYNTTITTINEDGSTTEETQEQPEVLTCGLPGKPACKIDESGTPDPDKTLDPEKKAKDAQKPLDELIADPEGKLPALPTLSWDFALPTGCAAISIPAFSPWLDAIDVCQFQPMFHDIMGVVWVLGGLFGAISMFWRNAFAG